MHCAIEKLPKFMQKTICNIWRDRTINDNCYFICLGFLHGALLLADNIEVSNEIALLSALA